MVLEITGFALNALAIILRVDQSILKDVVFLSRLTGGKLSFHF